MSRRPALSVLAVLVASFLLTACCGTSTCIKDPPCKKADCGCAK
jgi:uncharacterized lipoprotein YajG